MAPRTAPGRGMMAEIRRAWACAPGPEAGGGLPYISLSITRQFCLIFVKPLIWSALFPQGNVYRGSINFTTQAIQTPPASGPTDQEDAGAKSQSPDRRLVCDAARGTRQGTARPSNGGHRARPNPLPGEMPHLDQAWLPASPPPPIGAARARWFLTRGANTLRGLQ